MFELHSQILIMVNTPYVIMISVTVENVTIFRESSWLMCRAHQELLIFFSSFIIFLLLKEKFLHLVLNNIVEKLQ